MPYRIPLFDVNFGDEELEAVQDVVRSRWISMGPRTEAFESAFAEMLGAGSATALSSCTAALHLALRILGVGPGDEVIVPSLTFVATVNCIRYVNATAVFADVCGPEDLTVSPAAIERAITPRTRAIIAMHYAGFPCRMDEIMALAREHRLYVVEDAAHAPCTRYNGSHLGTIGDVGCFSFFSNKNITTAEGGMFVTRNDSFRQQARRLRSHGMTTLSYDRARGHATTYDVVDVGYNYRLDDLRAALGLAQLKKLKGDLTRRAVLRQHYLDGLKGLDHLSVPFANHRTDTSNYIFPVLLNGFGATGRDEVRSRLAERGIETSVHYPAAHRFTTYQQSRCRLPETENAADNLLTLPLYSGLKVEDVQYIVASLRAILDESRPLELRAHAG